MRTRTSSRVVVRAAGLAIAVAVAGATPAAAQADPPGNNGTVKVDDVLFDDHPGNEPHDGCTFQIDFYGFDAGDLYADVTFEAIDPTGAVDPLLTDTVFIGEDDNAGGGSVDGLDADGTYDLTEVLSGIEPHPVQGWHVALTVHADGAQGADVKHKVFWVSGCDVGTPPTSSTTVPDDQTTTTTTGQPGSSTTTVGVTPQGSTTVPSGPGGPDGPGGPSGSAPRTPVDTNPTAADGGLPVTGSDVGPLLALAAGMVAVGGAGLFAARRLRSDGS